MLDGTGISVSEWKSYLRRQPVFSAFNEKEIDGLLSSRACVETQYAANSVVPIDDERGIVSIIGRGAITIYSDQDQVGKQAMAELITGDCIGPRLASSTGIPRFTARAIQDTLVLDIRPDEAQDLFESHPELEAKFALGLCTRVAPALSPNSRPLELPREGEGGRLRAMSHAELKAVDSTLQAALLVFDQTKTKSEDVLERAEQASKTLVRSLKASFAVLLAVLTLAGVGAKNVYDETKEQLSTLTKQVDAVTEKASVVDSRLEATGNAQTELEKDIAQRKDEFLTIETNLHAYGGTLLDDELNKVGVPNNKELLRRYKLADALRGRDGLVINELEAKLYSAMKKNKDPSFPDYTEFLLGMYLDQRGQTYRAAGAPETEELKNLETERDIRKIRILLMLTANELGLEVEEPKQSQFSQRRDELAKLAGDQPRARLEWSDLNSTKDKVREFLDEEAFKMWEQLADTVQRP